MVKVLFFHLKSIKKILRILWCMTKVTTIPFNESSKSIVSCSPKSHPNLKSIVFNNFNPIVIYKFYRICIILLIPHLIYLNVSINVYFYAPNLPFLQKCIWIYCKLSINLALCLIIYNLKYQYKLHYSLKLQL